MKPTVNKEQVSSALGVGHLTTLWMIEDHRSPAGPSAYQLHNHEEASQSRHNPVKVKRKCTSGSIVIFSAVNQHYTLLWFL